MATPAELLPLEEAAKFLSVSKSTMYRLLDQGKLRGMKAGKQWRFRTEELLAYMQRGPAALALDNLSVQVLDAELEFFAAELQCAGMVVEHTDAECGDEAQSIKLLVQRMAWLLHARNGSDLHLEPVWENGETSTRVRVRVDGVLRDVRRLPARLHQAVVAQWKQLAGLNPDERSRPQDGSAYLLLPGETTPFPLRISVVPTIYGEKVAARAIPTRLPTMAELGIDTTPLAQWVRRGSGLVLVTGPSGSGKVTSAIACIRDRIAPDVNIMAIEEPIQYLLPGITQVHVDGFSPAEGLRAVLQQDADIILLGELCAEEGLAPLAAQAADTGHLVMATMHANDAIAPLYDLLEWGVKRPLLAANLVGVVNQRLLRKLCPHCKAPVELAPTVLEVVRAAAAAGGYPIPHETIFSGPTGCAQCHGTGYAGRFPLHEYFEFSPRLRTAFTGGAPYDGLRKLALEGGMRTSFAEGVRCAVAGITSLDEVQRRVPGWQ